MSNMVYLGKFISSYAVISFVIVLLSSVHNAVYKQFVAVHLSSETYGEFIFLLAIIHRRKVSDM